MSVCQIYDLILIVMHNYFFYNRFSQPQPGSQPQANGKGNIEQVCFCFINSAQGLAKKTKEK